MSIDKPKKYQEIYTPKTGKTEIKPYEEEEDYYEEEKNIMNDESMKMAFDMLSTPLDKESKEWIEKYKKNEIPLFNEKKKQNYEKIKKLIDYGIENDPDEDFRKILIMLKNEANKIIENQFDPKTIPRPPKPPPTIPPKPPIKK